MVIMQLPVWISIWITLIGNASTENKTEYACSDHNPQLNCTPSFIIVIKSSYGVNRGNNCGQGASCIVCCNQDTNNCLAPNPDVSVLNESCHLQSRCNISYNEVNITFGNGSQKKSDYLRVDYECVAGPSTTTPRPVTTTSNIVTSTATLSTRVSSTDKQTSLGLTSTSLNDAEQQPERLIIIVAVVVAVLVLSAILVIVFILHRRRCKKSSQEEAPKNQLPDVLINHSNLNFGGTDQDYKAVESSNYDEVNDESIASYSRPAKKKTDGSSIAKDEKKTGGNCATDEYDRIVFEEKYALKMTNYDSVSATEVKKVDDTYAHVSSQSKPASAAATNDYSHCQVIRNESRSNDYTYKTAVSNEPVIADNYSHVDLNAEKTKRRPSNIIEEVSYSHIELDKTTNPSRNGHAVSVRTIPKYKEGSQTFTDLQSLDAESQGWPVCDGNSGISSQEHPLQDIKAISLPDNYIEFKIGDIYDTPRCKDQQYNVVLKGNKGQLLNRIQTGSKRQSGTEEINGVTQDCAVRSDYELAKPRDF